MLKQDVVINEVYFLQSVLKKEVDFSRVLIVKHDSDDVFYVMDLKTKEFFYKSAGLLQNDPQIYIQMYKDQLEILENPKMLFFTPSYFNILEKNGTKEKQLILRIIAYQDTTLVEYVGNDGVVKTINNSWFDKLDETNFIKINMKRSLIPPKIRMNTIRTIQSIISSLNELQT